MRGGKTFYVHKIKVNFNLNISLKVALILGDNLWHHAKFLVLSFD